MGAVEKVSRHRFPVHASQPYIAGSFPEITHYLNTLGINFEVMCRNSRHDSFNGKAWAYVHNDIKIVVHDVPLTLLRIGI